MNDRNLIFEKPTEDYLRVMTASPEVLIGDPKSNSETIRVIYDEARDNGVELLVLPELCLTGYSAGDLFFNKHVLNKTIDSINDLAELTLNGPALAIGAPLEKDGQLYNCGIILSEGKIQGAVPKSYIPNYKEFYEKRWFSSGKNMHDTTIDINNTVVPFGTDLLFDINDRTIGVEICEDAWTCIPPSSYAALSGAEIIINLSASNETIGKADYRRDLVSGLAARLICAYVYTSSGRGESNADIAYGGHQIISENGRITGEIKPFKIGSLIVDIDTSELTTDRLVNKSFADQSSELEEVHKFRTLSSKVPAPKDDKLYRKVEKMPFVPNNPETLNERCEQIFDIMAHSLARRVADSDAHSLIIGLSGGLDSTLALLTSIYCCQILDKPLSFIRTVTMPSKASSDRTQDNATGLAGGIGTEHSIIPISEMTDNVLEALNHDKTTEDITFENTQARIRTMLLMNYANKTNGIVVGTGDLSESAQGWCTYNGDHMSMYNPNSGIPKTLVSHLVRWYATNHTESDVKKILLDILDTPVSPELTGNGDLSQSTDDIIGPIELRDFFLSRQNRHHETPNKTGYLATIAFKDVYAAEEIEYWLLKYLDRFTKSQWKRDVKPNGPKVGPVADSPRGDLRLPPNISIDWYK